MQRHKEAKELMNLNGTSADNKKDLLLVTDKILSCLGFHTTHFQTDFQKTDKMSEVSEAGREISEEGRGHKSNKDDNMLFLNQ